jgi:hypothetical protein
MCPFGSKMDTRILLPLCADCYIGEKMLEIEITYSAH